MYVNTIAETTWECIACTKVIHEEDIAIAHPNECHNSTQCKPIVVPHTKHYKTRTFSNELRPRGRPSSLRENHRGRHSFGSIKCEKCLEPLATRKELKRHMYIKHGY